MDFGLFQPTLKANRARSFHRAFDVVVAGFGCGREFCFGLFPVFQRQIDHSQNVHGDAVTRSSGKQLFSDDMLSQQVGSDSGADSLAGRTARFDFTQKSFDLLPGRDDLVGRDCSSHLAELVSRDLSLGL